MIEFILASTSPRRQQLIKDLGIQFRVVSPDIDESIRPREKPMAYVKRMALEKALKAESLVQKGVSDSYVIVTADTSVIFGSKILGKPLDEQDALRTLLSLNGRKHQVMTGFTVLAKIKSKRALVTKLLKTDVQFAKREKSFWSWYVTTGEPMDKAGSYAAQGVGMSFIEKISGSYSNVVGLPIAQLMDQLQHSLGQKIFKEVVPWHR